MTLILLRLLLAAGLSASDQVASSTGSGKAHAEGPGPVFGAPLRLRFLLDDRGQPRGDLGFSVRWDASDLPGLPRRAARLALDPFGTTERAAREILTGAEIGLYALHFKADAILPIGFLLSPLSQAASWMGPPARRLSGGARLDRPADALPAPPSDRRHRLRLTPAREEIERGLRRDLHRAIVNAGFNLALPSRLSVPYAQKQAILDSIRAAGNVWEEDLRGEP
ncbi:MAG: hypothetical protein HYZ75_05965 [Elusimicrobia bacterium]|nr:hypothetical protein [Elusimicrobiota bacterium]